MPLSVGIATLAGQHSSEFALMMAASVMAMAPIFLLFFSMQRKVIEGLASSGLKGLARVAGCRELLPALPRRFRGSGSSEPMWLMWRRMAMS